MKTLVIVLLSFLALNAHANEACVTQDEAREILLQQDRVVLKNLKSQYQVGLCKGTPNQGCITKTHLTQVLLQTTWNEQRQVYLSGSLHHWLCGPGADCWAHATLTCKGEVNIVIIGD